MSKISFKIISICLVVTTTVLGITVFFTPTALSSFRTADSDVFKIMTQLRFPRALLAFLAGGTLAICGSVFQTLFRNPLASPYTLGVSAGAAFGASLAIVFCSAFASATLIVFIAALLGSLLSTWLVLRIGRGHTIDSAGLVLAGVVITFFFGSISLFLQYVSDYSKVFALSRWMMGSVGIVGWYELGVLAPVVLCGLSYLLRHSAALDMLLYGDEISFARGVDPQQYTTRFVCCVSLLVGLVVAVCGPLSFIGIIIPHSVRLLGFNKHQLLLFVSFFVGGIFLVMSDALARTVSYPFELPVGIITALFGAPFFLYLLLTRQTL